jgi:histidinol-phosphate/aromatic aminotransferase/cobyric acid decarboxylase-like protein
MGNDSLSSTHGGNLFAVCRERGWNWRDVLDLSASINPFGSAPGVRAAIESALDWIDRYPDETPSELEGALAAAWGVPSDLVLAGAGATELLNYFARSGWQGPVALVTPVWSEFYRAFPHALRVSLNEPERWPHRGLLVMSQPANPTGEAIAEELVRRTIASREGPVLIDESFIEFTSIEPAVGWCESYPNLIVLRSLSKFQALPGLRVGALVASRDWITRLRKRREPWTVGTLAAAGARAAVADMEHAKQTREMIAEERQWLLEQLVDVDGLQFAPGVANFLLATTNKPASDVYAQFLDRMIIVRNCTGLPGVEGQAIRIAVRTRAENARFVAAAKEIFAPAPVSDRPEQD